MNSLDDFYRLTCGPINMQEANAALYAAVELIESSLRDRVKLIDPLKDGISNIQLCYLRLHQNEMANVCSALLRNLDVRSLPSKVIFDWKEEGSIIWTRVENKIYINVPTKKGLLSHEVPYIEGQFHFQGKAFESRKDLENYAMAHNPFYQGGGRTDRKIKQIVEDIEEKRPIPPDYKVNVTNKEALKQLLEYAIEEESWDYVVLFAKNHRFHNMVMSLNQKLFDKLLTKADELPLARAIMLRCDQEEIAKHNIPKRIQFFYGSPENWESLLPKLDSTTLFEDLVDEKPLEKYPDKVRALIEFLYSKEIASIKLTGGVISDAIFDFLIEKKIVPPIEIIPELFIRVAETGSFSLSMEWLRISPDAEKLDKLIPSLNPVYNRQIEELKEFIQDHVKDPVSTLKQAILQNNPTVVKIMEEVFPSKENQMRRIVRWISHSGHPELINHFYPNPTLYIHFAVECNDWHLVEHILPATLSLDTVKFAARNGYLSCLKVLRPKNPWKRIKVNTIDKAELRDWIWHCHLQSETNDLFEYIDSLKIPHDWITEFKKEILTYGSMFTRLPKREHQVNVFHEYHSLYVAFSPEMFRERQYSFGVTRNAVCKRVMESIRNKELKTFSEVLRELTSGRRGDKFGTIRYEDHTSSCSGTTSRFFTAFPLVWQQRKRHALGKTDYNSGKYDTVTLCRTEILGDEFCWEYMSLEDSEKLMWEMDALWDTPHYLQKCAKLYALGCHALITNRGNSQMFFEVHRILLELNGLIAMPQMKFPYMDCAALATNIEEFCNEIYPHCFLYFDSKTFQQVI